MSGSRARIKTGKASLFGGIAVGIASLAIWVGVTQELGFSGVPVVVLGVLVSVGVATWIRVADL
jgi:hypothetical protein